MPHLDGYDASQRIRQYFYENRLTQPIISAIVKDIQSLFKFTALNTDAFQDAHIAIFQQIADTNQVSIKV